MNSADRAGTTLEQVVDEMVSQGAQLIFTTSDDFADDTDVAAAKYPNIPLSTFPVTTSSRARLRPTSPTTWPRWST